MISIKTGEVNLEAAVLPCSRSCSSLEFRGWKRCGTWFGIWCALHCHTGDKNMRFRRYVFRCGFEGSISKTLPLSKSRRTNSLPSKIVKEGMMRQVWSNTADFVTSIWSGRERSCTKKDVFRSLRFQWKLSLCFSEIARVWRISMTSTFFPQED